jgi:ribonuclease P/MRP protein subunit POP5
MKLKSLPTLREKKRYVFFRVHSDGIPDYNEIRDAINNSLFEWLGDRHFSGAKIRVIRNLWDRNSRTGVIRCSHKSVDDIKVGMSLIHQIGDSKVIFQTLRISGTIKSGMDKIGMRKPANIVPRKSPVEIKKEDRPQKKPEKKKAARPAKPKVQRKPKK